MVTPSGASPSSGAYATQKRPPAWWPLFRSFARLAALPRRRGRRLLRLGRLRGLRLQRGLRLLLGLDLFLERLGRRRVALRLRRLAGLLVRLDRLVHRLETVMLRSPFLLRGVHLLRREARASHRDRSDENGQIHALHGPSRTVSRKVSMPNRVKDGILSA